jgi:hypothetical protein
MEHALRKHAATLARVRASGTVMTETRERGRVYLVVKPSRERRHSRNV